MKDADGTISQADRFSFVPMPPANLRELDIPEAVAMDILLARLYREGVSSLKSLSQGLKLPFAVVSELFQKLRALQVFEITGIEGNNYSFSLTSSARETVEKQLARSAYSGPAPVSLRAYSDAVRAQAAEVSLDREKLRGVLADLVLTDELLDRLGPALVSQNPVFLHGPTGNGKTSIAAALRGIYGDLVFVPHAVEFDGQIVLVYDPAVHGKADLDVPEHDGRWVPCERPCVTVGGELDLGMLELRRDETSGTYIAPPHMKANNGIFIIDDFGRQMVSPQHLLNRWIVPLDRAVDYLTLSYGLKFEIPFRVAIVFATNIEPDELGDAAFFRRIRNKIYVGPVEDDVFDEIFRRLLARRRIECDPKIPGILRALCRSGPNGEGLCACYAKDILQIVEAIGKYEGRPVELDEDVLRRATSLYFSRVC